jgi:hypothetical protein
MSLRKGPQTLGAKHETRLAPSFPAQSHFLVFLCVSPLILKRCLFSLVMSQKKSVFKHLSSLFQQLSLSSLPDELVERLSNGELFDKSHVNNTILSVRNETLSELEQELSHLLVELHSSPSSNQSRLWTLFTEWKISPKKFVAFLHIILLQDTSGSVTAANCLLNLLQFPGSNVFNVFNPFVYRAVLDTLRKQLFPQMTTKGKEHSSHTLL